MKKALNKILLTKYLTDKKIKMPKIIKYKFPKFDWDLFKGGVIMSMTSSGGHHTFVIKGVTANITINFDGFHVETKHFDENCIIETVILSQSIGFQLLGCLQKSGLKSDAYQQLFFQFKTDSRYKKEMGCAVKNLEITVELF